MVANFRFSSDKKNLKHHENNFNFENRFRKHRQLLINAFLQFGNPFSPQIPGLQNIVSKEIFPAPNSESVVNALSSGKNQRQIFTKT